MDLAIFRKPTRLLGRLLRRVGASSLVRTSPPIASLGVTGNRAIAAVITAAADICWYRPGSFDAPSLLGSLLDPGVGGTWRIELPRAAPTVRRDIERSAVLEITLLHPDGSLAVTDWMPLAGAGQRHG